MRHRHTDLDATQPARNIHLRKFLSIANGSPNVAGEVDTRKTALEVAGVLLSWVLIAMVIGAIVLFFLYLRKHFYK